MLRERLQILISTEQRRRLEGEAKQRGACVASLIREAIDARFASTTKANRMQALEEIRAMGGHFLAPDEIDRVVEAERAGQLDAILDSSRR